MTQKKIDCSGACLTCYGENENECLSCQTKKFFESGSCLLNCSVGNYPDQNNFCQGSFIFLILILKFYFF